MNKNTDCAEIDLMDDGNPLRVRIHKMGAVKGSDWIARLVATIAKAGVKGDGLATFLSMLDKEMKDAMSGGQFLFQLPGITFEDIKALYAPLLADCQIVRNDSVSGKTLTIPLNSDALVSANIRSVSALMKLRWEVIKYNFGPLLEGVRSKSESRESLQSDSPSTGTSIPSLDSLSAGESATPTSRTGIAMRMR
jgi:hypothetical protein